MIGHMRLACVIAAVVVGSVSWVGFSGFAQADGAPLLQLRVGTGGTWTSSPPPMFNIKHLAPGSTIGSEVRVRDAGSSAGSLSLQARDVVESGGVGGSRPYGCGVADGLADHLVINVAQQLDGALSPLFSGSLCALGARSAQLGSTQLQPGAEADYVLSAYLPSGVGNDEQGASASWSLAWRITSDSGDSSDVVTRVLGEKATRAGNHGVLAFTGFDALNWTATGLLAVLFGTFLALVRSRRGRVGTGR